MQSQPDEPGVGLEIDASELLEGFFPEPEPQMLKIEVGDPNDKMLYSLVASLSALSERIVQTEQRQNEIVQALVNLSEQMKHDREALVSAIEPVINVTVPEPIVNVTIPDIVFPEMPTPVVNVSPPEVNVTVEAPVTRRKVDVTRDPVSGFIASATIEEVTDDGR